MTQEESNITEYISLECRWFLVKPIAKEILDMFRGLDVETRTDVYWTRNMYLVHPILDEGIKLREGGLEIKTILKKVEGLAIPGKVQKWRKIRKPIPPDIDLSNGWTEVPKRRQMIRYELFPDHIAGPVSHFPDQGCHIELTSFESPFENYWTFGIEAYGHDYELNGNLVRVYDKIVGQSSELKQILNNESSRSYPEWLAGIK